MEVDLMYRHSEFLYLFILYALTLSWAILFIASRMRREGKSKESYSTLTMKAWNRRYLSWSEIPRIDFSQLLSETRGAPKCCFISGVRKFARVTEIIRLCSVSIKLNTWSDCSTNLIFISRSLLENALLIEKRSNNSECASVEYFRF
jgi:hypothetical protein